MAVPLRVLTKEAPRPEAASASETRLPVSAEDDAVMHSAATAMIGPIEAMPVRPKLLSFPCFVDAETPRPKARMNGTARGPVVAPLASKLMEAILWPTNDTRTNTMR